MKKTLLITAMFALCISANAQTSSTSSSGFTSYFSAGPRVGVNLSTFSGVDEAETKAGLMAGAFLVYSFQEHFGVSLDLLYSAQGAKYTTTFTSGGNTIKSKVKTKVNYLQVPLQANVFFNKFGDAFRPKITLGPSIGFLMSAENKSDLTVSDGTNTTESSTETDAKDNFNSVDFGAMVGAGFNLRVADQTWFNFDLRYLIGATDIRDVQPAGTDEVKNMVPSISAGLAFGF